MEKKKEAIDTRRMEGKPCQRRSTHRRRTRWRSSDVSASIFRDPSMEATASFSSHAASTASADSTSRNHLHHGRQPPPVVAASIILVCGLRVFHGSNPQTNGPPSPSCGSIPVRLQPTLGTGTAGPSGLGAGRSTVSLNR